MTITKEQLAAAVTKREVPTIAGLFPLSHFRISRDGVVSLTGPGLVAMEAQRQDKWTEEEALEWAIPE